MNRDYYFCTSCGAKESDDQKEYDRDCNCGGSFATAEEAIECLAIEVRRLEERLYDVHRRAR